MLSLLQIFVMDFAAFGQRLKIALAFIVEGESYMMRLQSGQTPPPSSGGQGKGGGLARPGGNTKIFLRQFCLSCCLAFSCVVTFGAGTVRNAWLRCCPEPPTRSTSAPPSAAKASPPSRAAKLANFWPLWDILKYFTGTLKLL